MNVWTLALAIWALGALTMTVAWSVAMRIRNIGHVDVAWAGLLSAAALLAGMFSPGAALPRMLTAAMGAVWGARLCVHLLRRVLREAEDGRYQALRARWDESPVKFFVFFQVQALVAALFALTFLAAANNPVESVRGWSIAAIVVWVVAVGGESIADAQLAAYREDPGNAGTTCRGGLWACSRHPNYFFEWLHWFAYVLLAVGSPYDWLAWLGPLLMLALLHRARGIPWTEQQALRSRGDDYLRYQQEVSAFVPRLPRNR